MWAGTCARWGMFQGPGRHSLKVPRRTGRVWLGAGLLRTPDSEVIPWSEVQRQGSPLLLWHQGGTWPPEGTGSPLPGPMELLLLRPPGPRGSFHGTRRSSRTCPLLGQRRFLWHPVCCPVPPRTGDGGDGRWLQAGASPAHLQVPSSPL